MLVCILLPSGAAAQFGGTHSQTIFNFNPASPVVFGAAPASLSADFIGLGPIVYATTSAASVCTVSSNIVTFTGAGICNLTADMAGGHLITPWGPEVYTAAPQVTASIVINPAAQAITGFNPASPVVFGAAPATLTATGGASGNPIVYATTSPASVCTVSGSTVTFTGAGTCNLTANQAGNASYSAAPQVTASITVNPRTSYSGTAPAGGNISASFLGGGPTCSFVAPQFTTSTPPNGINLPYGTFSFTTTQCNAGATLTFTLTYPQPLPAGAKYYKYGPEFGGSATPHWYVLPGAVVNGNQVTFSITDNGQGDSDPTPGVITDPGGVGVPVSDVSGVPTLSEWALVLLAGMAAALGRTQLRRRPHA
jgi:hypothetical protein